MKEVTIMTIITMKNKEYFDKYGNSYTQYQKVRRASTEVRNDYERITIMTIGRI